MNESETKLNKSENAWEIEFWGERWSDRNLTNPLEFNESTGNLTNLLEFNESIGKVTRRTEQDSHTERGVDSTTDRRLPVKRSPDGRRTDRP